MNYKTNLVIDEILETEKSYIKLLKELIVEYFEYWKHTKILSKEHCNQLFGNITEIYSFSRIFLKELELTNNNVAEIAHCFLSNHLKFIVYSTYCNNFPNSELMLSEIMQSRPPINIIHQRQKELGHRLPLGSYLVLPIQRILRYHLLLKKLSLYTSDNVSDHALVIRAHDKMVLLAKIIDETKSKYEKGSHIKKMRQMIKRWRDKTNVQVPNNVFELHAEGNLVIAGTKKKLHVILFNNMLLMAKEQKCGSMEYKAHISNRNIIVIENVEENPLSFRLMSNVEPKYSYTFQASLKEEKTHWINTLNSIKEDFIELPKIDFGELLADCFYISKSIRPNKF